MPAESHLPVILFELTGTKRLADRAIAQIEPAQLFAKLGDTDNSIATIMKHMSGNMLSRWKDFLTSDGEKPGRDRDAEFTVVPDDTPETLTERWEEGWSMLFAALSPLTPADLDRTVTIRGEQLTALQAINRQLSHYSYHVGQIVFLAKHLAGPKWKSLTIPLGGSAAFNKAPQKYIPTPK